MSILLGILNTLLVLTSIFLICLILIQRGKGGGLAGAFGGSGGSSAFGTKAGDIFTRVTMITAVIWILLNISLVFLANNRTSTSPWDDDVPAGASTTTSSKTNIPIGAPSGSPLSESGSSLVPGPPSTGAPLGGVPSESNLPASPGSPSNPINPETPPEPVAPKSNL